MWDYLRITAAILFDKYYQRWDFFHLNFLFLMYLNIEKNTKHHHYGFVAHFIFGLMLNVYSETKHV